MPKASKVKEEKSRRFALCLGIGTYQHLVNRDLRYAVTDAQIIAKRLADPYRGDFTVTLLTEPAQTTKHALDNILYEKLKAPSSKEDDLVVIFFACHGGIYGKNNTFYLMPSDAKLEN